MGRGRAKAIQKRIARDLKYSTTGTDLDRLRAELASQTPEPGEPGEAGDDGYAGWVDSDDADEADGAER